MVGHVSPNRQQLPRQMLAFDRVVMDPLPELSKLVVGRSEDDRINW